MVEPQVGDVQQRFMSVYALRFLRARAAALAKLNHR